MSLVNVTCPCGVACEAIRTGDVSRPITASATTNIAETAFRTEVCFALIVTTPFEMAPKTSVRIFQTRRGGGGLHPSCNRRIYHHHAPRVSGMSSVALAPKPGSGGQETTRWTARNAPTLFTNVHGGGPALVAQCLHRAS